MGEHSPALKLIWIALRRPESYISLYYKYMVFFRSDKILSRGLLMGRGITLQFHVDLTLLVAEQIYFFFKPNIFSF